ncbi:hypothetical protein GDO78_000441 [Eleutherodactylus coqui]|uniref:Uncharacterized protein n=1 Tax=Eleutherodactylus coqui TaxID=57060 RepID=A0A8J6FSD6_ELECQ|nr:hypothetical protein GDO78_000441 [Eleutherodactylus coqui]
MYREQEKVKSSNHTTPILVGSAPPLPSSLPILFINNNLYLYSTNIFHSIYKTGNKIKTTVTCSNQLMVTVGVRVLLQRSGERLDIGVKERLGSNITPRQRACWEL